MQKLQPAGAARKKPLPIFSGQNRRRLATLSLFARIAVFSPFAEGFEGGKHAFSGRQE